jgi:hypothetical protein
LHYRNFPFKNAEPKRRQILQSVQIHFVRKMIKGGKKGKTTKPVSQPPRLRSQRVTPPSSSEDMYQRYVSWLHSNGCIFPRIEYPAKLGPFQIIGAKAKYDIPPNTAFLFVSHKLIITPKKGKNSEIGFIMRQHKKMFYNHPERDDYVLYLFIMYEKLKGYKSFWHPYLEIVEGMDLAMFWEDSELSEL